MLAIRTLQMLAVGICLLLMAKYWQLVFATVRGCEALMKRPFFDVETLMAESRERMERHRGDPQACPLPLELLHVPLRRWLSSQLRKVARAGADAGGR